MSNLEKLLDGLHEAVAERLLAAIKNPELLDHRLLKEAREFLNDNGIDLAKKSRRRGKLHSIAAELPIEDPELTQDHGRIVS